MELVTYKIDIVAVSETRLPESVHHQEKKHTIYWSRKEGNQSRQSGVTLVVKNEPVRELKELSEWVSERIIKLRIPVNAVEHMNIINGYAPASKLGKNAKETFYDQLHIRPPPLRIH